MHQPKFFQTMYNIYKMNDSVLYVQLVESSAGPSIVTPFAAKEVQC